MLFRLAAHFPDRQDELDTGFVDGRSHFLYVPL